MMNLSIGDRIIAVSSDYTGLKGYITDIKTGRDKETENDTDDIYCCFDIPESPDKVRLLENHFSLLHGSRKTIDDLGLDMVIMTPEMLRVLDNNV